MDFGGTCVRSSEIHRFDDIKGVSLKQRLQAKLLLTGGDFRDFSGINQFSLIDSAAAKLALSVRLMLEMLPLNRSIFLGYHGFLASGGLGKAERMFITDRPESEVSAGLS